MRIQSEGGECDAQSCEKSPERQKVQYESENRCVCGRDCAVSVIHVGAEKDASRRLYVFEMSEGYGSRDTMDRMRNEKVQSVPE